MLFWWRKVLAFWACSPSAPATCPLYKVRGRRAACFVNPGFAEIHFHLFVWTCGCKGWNIVSLTAACHIPLPLVCLPLGWGVSESSQQKKCLIFFFIWIRSGCILLMYYLWFSCFGGVSLVFIFIGGSQNTFNMSVLCFLKLNYFSVHWILAPGNIISLLYNIF